MLITASPAVKLTDGLKASKEYLWEYTYYLQKKAKVMDVKILQGKFLTLNFWRSENEYTMDDKYPKIMRLGH